MDIPFDLDIPFEAVNVIKSNILFKAPMALVLNAMILIPLLWDSIMTDVTVLQMPSTMKMMVHVNAKKVTFNLELHAN